MAIPVTGDRLPVTWAIGLKRPPKQFTVSDLEETVERAALVGALLENQILAGELARAHQQIDRDARQVGELQRALLPASLPRIAGMEIAASYEPLGLRGRRSLRLLSSRRAPGRPSRYPHGPESLVRLHRRHRGTRIGRRDGHGDRAGRAPRTSRRDRHSRGPVEVRQPTVVQQQGQRPRNGIPRNL